MKNSKIANIRVTVKDFFKYWLLTTKRYNKLSEREIDIVALLLYYRYSYSKEILNEKMLWKLVFDYDTRLLIKEELNMTNSNFENNLTNIRVKGVIKDNIIKSAYIPDIELEAKNFKVIFNYNIIGNG